MKVTLGWDWSDFYKDGIGICCSAESNQLLIAQGISILFSDDQGAGYKKTLPAWEEMNLRINQYRNGQINENIFNNHCYWDYCDFWSDCSSVTIQNNLVYVCFMTDFEISLTLEAFQTLIANYVALAKENPNPEKNIAFEIEEPKLVTKPENYQDYKKMLVYFFWRQEYSKIVPKTKAYSANEIANVCIRILFDLSKNVNEVAEIKIDEYEQLLLVLKNSSLHQSNNINLDLLSPTKFKFTEVNFELQMVKIKTIDYIVTMQLNVFITMLEQYIKLLKTGDKYQIIEFEIPEPDVVLIGN